MGPEGAGSSARAAREPSARPAILLLAQERKATVVLEAGAVLWRQAEDITAAVIARVDLGGPLSP